jgi:hypothetical protein
VPTARELLEQADALMRRNRARVEDDIPVLLDAVPSAAEARIRAPLTQPQNFSAPFGPAAADDVPVLTDTVEEIEALSIVGGEESEGEPSMWLEFGHNEPSIIGDAPDSIAIVPPVDLRRPPPAPEEDEPFDDEIAAVEPPVRDEIRRAAVRGDEVAAMVPAPPVAAEIAPVAVAVPIPVPTPTFAPTLDFEDTAKWDAIAEEVRMQVLQRIDLFTDTGMRTQLGARLQPIVDRASADLVASISQHVGELLRVYVAEAIEREIESWRRNH